MDYESEEDDLGDDVEDKDVSDEEVEKVENGTAEELLQESVKSRMRNKKGGVALRQMRINSVLESNPAIESYCYDQLHELWCEVSS